MPDTPTVVIVDDAAEVRTLMKTRLRLSGMFRVVGEGSDGAQDVELARLHAPSLMLLDVSMPGVDGLEALPRILEAAPSTRVVLFSGFEEQGLADEARALGVLGHQVGDSRLSGVRPPRAWWRRVLL